MRRARASRDSKKASQTAVVKEWSNNPFRALKPLAPKAAPLPTPAKPVVTPPAPAPPPPSDDDLFQRAVAGAKPLSAHARDRVAQASPAATPREVTDPEAEALAELCDLVNGNAPFDVTSSDEHIEGMVLGLDPRLIRRLRDGEFAYQAFLDLHRMTTEEARPAVESFLIHAYQSGKRCVLIVHGRGRNSKDQVPVLKQKLTQWLSRGVWSHWVLGFTSARPCDGGVGALYVLLRRKRHTKQPIRVTNGAKH